MTIIWTLHKVSAIYLHLPQIRALYIIFNSWNLTRCIKYTQLFIIRVVASGTSHPRSWAFKTTCSCEIFVILWTAIRLMSTCVMDVSVVETEMKWAATAAICPVLSNCHWWVSCYWCCPHVCGRGERERERERGGGSRGVASELVATKKGSCSDILVWTFSLTAASCLITVGGAESGSCPGKGITNLQQLYTDCITSPCE